MMPCINGQEHALIKSYCPSCVASSGPGGCDWRGVCAVDASGVWSTGAADSEWATAAGGAGGGAGLP